MSYINAEKVLPEWLVETIRSYVGDGLIYIPPADSSRKKWGSRSGAREMFEARNNEIRRKKSEGVTVSQLAKEYHLSENTIKQIVYR
ncbi:MAG: hypothetical protein K2J04_07440 [Lachnospiraceae bacterium]|nr:hypothetical protein [Lachnospiraceae bacterium]